MDIKIDQKYRFIASQSLKISAILVFISTAIAIAFTDDGGFSDGWGLLFFYGFIGTVAWILIPYALCLTPNRNSQSYGASMILFVGLSIISMMIYSVLDGQGLEWVFDDFLYTQLIFFVLLSSFISALYLVTTAGDRSNIVYKGIAALAVPLLVFVQTWNTFPNSDVGDAFEGWAWEPVVAITISLIIGTIVLFFSDVKVSSFLLLVFSAGMTIYQFMNVINLLQSESRSQVQVYDDYYDDFSYSTKPSALVLIQFIVALVCFIYALYITNFNGKELVSDS